MSHMQEESIIFRIRRYRPKRIDPPRFEDFQVRVSGGMTVLDGLEQIRLGQDPSLIYRHSCHHLSCGTCACKINGKPGPVCHTRLQDLSERIIVLEPLDGFSCVSDLLVDMGYFYGNLRTDWSNVQPASFRGSNKNSSGAGDGECFENCIECGICVSACPAVEAEPRFFGPAVLAAIHRQMLKHPDKEVDLIRLADEEYGQRLCSRALTCSRVCPTGVHPARHIAELRRRAGRQGNESS